MNKSNNLTNEEKKIIKLWISLVCAGKSIDEIELLTEHRIIAEGFEKTNAAMTKILENKKEASEYIRGLYY